MPLNHTRGESRAPKLEPRLAVLLVEDNADMAATLRGMLEQDGYGVAHASDAPGAQALLHSDRPDIVLLDCHLPRGGMMEVMAMADRRGLAVILMSGDREMLSQLAAFGYRHLCKPFRLRQLLLTVEGAVHRQPVRTRYPVLTN